MQTVGEAEQLQGWASPRRALGGGTPGARAQASLRIGRTATVAGAQRTKGAGAWEAQAHSAGRSSGRQVALPVLTLLFRAALLERASLCSPPDGN